MQRRTVLGRDTERETLVTAGCFSNKIRIDSSEIGIPGLVVFVQSDKYNIMVWHTFIEPPSLNTVVDKSSINSAATKIVIGIGGPAVGLWQKQYLLTLRFWTIHSRWSEICCLPGDPLHGFHERDLLHFDEIIQRIIAAESTREPVPFAIGNL